MESIGTATPVNLRPVVAVIIGRRTIRMREGTNDFNAAERVTPYVRAAAWTFGFKDTPVGLVMVVVGVRNLGDKDCWKRATARLAKLGAT